MHPTRRRMAGSVIALALSCGALVATHPGYKIQPIWMGEATLDGRVVVVGGMAKRSLTLEIVDPDPRVESYTSRLELQLGLSPIEPWPHHARFEDSGPPYPPEDSGPETLVLTVNDRCGMVARADYFVAGDRKFPFELGWRYPGEISQDACRDGRACTSSEPCWLALVFESESPWVVDYTLEVVVYAHLPEEFDVVDDWVELELLLED